MKAADPRQFFPRIYRNNIVILFILQDFSIYIIKINIYDFKFILNCKICIIYKYHTMINIYKAYL